MFFEKLHARSPETRRTIALAGAVVVTGLVALIWLSMLDVRLTGAVRDREGQEAVVAETGFSDSLKEIGGMFREGFGTLFEEVRGEQ